MPATDIFIKMILDRWNASIANFDTLLNTLSDETLAKEMAPGKNRGIYILGHMVAVHDDMLQKLDMGGMMHPELQEPFVNLPDKAATELPSISELRTMWKNQCTLLNEKFKALKPEQWFERHTAVSTEDFVREPHRNKLNIILTRTTHLTYHTGQLALMK